MSFDVILWVMHNSEETLGRRLVLLALAENANDDGSGAWPSVETLARKSRLSTRQVKRCLKGLEDGGALVSEGVGPKGTKSWRVVMAEGDDNLSGGDNLSSESGQDVTRTCPTEPIEGEDTPPTPPGASHDDVARVWNCYVVTMEPRFHGLPADERRLIREALRVATVDECCTAIKGCARSPHHMGQNDRGKKYNKLTNILKGKRGGKTLREQIDMFLEIADRTGASSALGERIKQAKRDVLLAHDMPGSQHAQEKGDESAAWLAQHGFGVVFDPSSKRLTFTRDSSTPT